MPTLNWMGKDKVVNHHRDVPYRILERVPEKGMLDSHGSDCGNMIIHGDNLEALKALLPEYEGKVDCIYIDPPYNTGNEGWVYNDNVNDPRIKKWIGEVVGKEGEDFSRHDKWLCMMYPRLQLLRKMLKETGAIFISIGDDECSNLKLICDEIFGLNCFVSNVVWQRTLTKRNDSKGVPVEAEHLLVYSKSPDWQPKKLPRTQSMNDSYSSPDGDQRAWTSVTCNAPGAATHQGMVYAIQQPITGELMYPPNGRCWALGQDRMLEEMSEWADYELRSLDDADKRREICKGADVPEDLCALMLVDDSLDARSKTKTLYDLGLSGHRPWPTFFFTSRGNGGMRSKKYLDENAGRVATNFWPASEVGTTDGAKRLLAKEFGGAAPFDTPKPPELISRCLELASGGNSIILDCFAGSCSTAEAVLNMNNTDNGCRQFVCIEMMDYADSITAERVRRVLAGYGTGRNAVPGIDSGFSYYELGPVLFDGDGALNPDVDTLDVMKYVWHTETKEPFMDCTDECPYLMGTVGHTVYYLCYEPGEEVCLTPELLGAFTRREQTTVVYADRCLIDSDTLDRLGIVFKQVPREIVRM